jgi:hypothetical protein
LKVAKRMKDVEMNLENHGNFTKKHLV